MPGTHPDLEILARQMIGVPYPVFICDCSGKVVFGNPAAHALYAPSRRKNTPDKWTSIAETWRPDGKRIAGTEYPMSRALGGESVSGEVLDVVSRDSGQRHRVNIDAFPLRDAQGTLIGAISLHRPVVSA